MAWTYSDWITQTGTADKRTRLGLHLVEISNKIEGFKSQGAVGQSAARFELQVYYDRMFAEHQRLSNILGLDDAADVQHFVRLKPQINLDNYN